MIANQGRYRQLSNIFLIFLIRPPQSNGGMDGITGIVLCTLKVMAYKFDRD
jgi:hypothetical protein